MAFHGVEASWLGTHMVGREPMDSRNPLEDIPGNRLVDVLGPDGVDADRKLGVEGSDGMDADHTRDRMRNFDGRNLVDWCVDPGFDGNFAVGDWMKQPEESFECSGLVPCVHSALCPDPNFHRSYPGHSHF